MINNGLENEMRIIQEIDHRRIKKMTPSIQKLLYKIYPGVNQYRMFYAQKCGDYDKADIMVELLNERHYISVKCYSAKCIHSSYIKPILKFLKERGVSNETLKTILYFQYGDGTIDGTGKTRYDYNTLMVKLKNRIALANKELNSKKSLIIDFADMCLFKGSHPELTQADYIYHGTVDYGYGCSKTEIFNYLKIRNFNFLENLHIGPILIHPYARYTDFKENNPQKRHMVQCDWPNLARDLEYISNGFRY